MLQPFEKFYLLIGGLPYTDSTTKTTFFYTNFVPKRFGTENMSVLG
jgi:hypothetical protein